MDEHDGTTTTTTGQPPAEPEPGPNPNLYTFDRLREPRVPRNYLRHARLGWTVVALCLLTLVAWWIWNWVH